MEPLPYTWSKLKYTALFLLSVMAPVLQRFVRFAVRVLFRRLFLRKMTLVVCHNFPHMGDVFLVILVWVLVGILLQDLDDISAASWG